MATGTRVDPYRLYNFRVEFDGLTRAGFMECSGLESSQAVIGYREGNERLAIRQLPGLISHSNIILRRGMTVDKELWTWRKTVIDGNVERKNGSIIMLDDAGNVQGSWNLINAWPVRWIGPQLDATGNGVAIEALEIIHEGISLGGGGGSSSAA